MDLLQQEVEMAAAATASLRSKEAAAEAAAAAAESPAPAAGSNNTTVIPKRSGVRIRDHNAEEQSFYRDQNILESVEDVTLSPPPVESTAGAAPVGDGSPEDVFGE